MHKVIPSPDGWITEYLRDDSDIRSAENPEEALLSGCSFILYVREGEEYVARVRCEEHSRRKITVEGAVWSRNGTSPHQKSLENAVFLEEKEFDIPGSELSNRQKAYTYAKELKDKITGKYFP